VENITGFDASPTLPGQTYCLTMTVGGASATTAVSACSIAGLVI